MTAATTPPIVARIITYIVFLCIKYNHYDYDYTLHLQAETDT